MHTAYMLEGDKITKFYLKKIQTLKVILQRVKGTLHLLNVLKNCNYKNIAQFTTPAISSIKDVHFFCFKRRDFDM